MTRMSSLFAAATLATLPISAFAQTASQTMPAASPAATQMGQPATATPAPNTKATTSTITTSTPTTSNKVAKTGHSKPTATIPSATTKIAEPNKS